MRITPLDIRKQEFRKAMRGLDAEEVYAFLSTVGDEYETILNDNKALRERLLELDDKVQEYRTMEKTLRDTLLTAERVTVESKDNARREASLIIKEAQIEADRSLRDIKSEAMKLRQEVSQLRSQRESYLGRMKVIAESLLRFIESVEEDFHSEDEAYKKQLPADDVPRQNSAPAEAPTQHGNLFDDDANERSADGGSRSAAVAGASPATSSGVDDRLPPVPGISPDLRTPGVDKPPAPKSDEARNESETRSTMANINSIIERMADGQKEISGQRPRPQAESAPRATRRPEQFDPVSAAPAGPIASGDAADEPPQTLEATTTTDDPTPARGIPIARSKTDTSVPAEGEWKRSPAVATSVDAVDDGEDATKQRNTEDKATGELSLEQIRRDLARRMSEEKDK